MGYVVWCRIWILNGIYNEGGLNLSDIRNVSIIPTLLGRVFCYIFIFIVMNRYIEHIISDLVRDTRIDYEKDFIYLPYLPPHLSPTYLSFISLFPSSYFFSDYCKERYGLTEEEIDYVWDVYKIIIKDKIINNE